ncbi:MAG: hypothetical protein ACRDBG_21080 [Waterburya sp.]
MGWSFFEDCELKNSGQVNTLNSTFLVVRDLFYTYTPQLVVCEDYRIYANKASEHINSELFTAKLIGRIQHECDANNIPYIMQMAHEGKDFTTDSKLIGWGLVSGSQMHENRHAIDSIRHGVHFILFGNAP